MFIPAMRRRNPELITSAATLHAAGRIPSNCFVIDLDTVSRNAARLSSAAADAGLSLYQMTKQFGRNPLVAAAIAANGIPKVVAVDIEEARLLWNSGLEIGHLGHLVQLPRSQVTAAIEMAPEFITVFGYDQTIAIAEVARRAGRQQDVLLRVVAAEDTFYPGQRGGTPVAELIDTARRIDALPGVRLAGVTSFPCLLWDEELGELRATPNLATLGRASTALREAGLNAEVVNAPSATCSAVLPMLADAGATHVEPGSSLIGQTPLHAVQNEPEVPAMVYVSEISHTDGDVGYSIAGGLYPRSRAQHAMVFDELASEPLQARVRLEPPDTIDYYGTLDFSQAAGRPRPGQTVVYAFRAQVFVSRSFVAVVSGVGGDPVVEGVYDRNGYRLNEQLLAATPTL